MKMLRLGAVLEDSRMKERIANEMRSGALFIYPTDTLYGIGCNAEVEKSVGLIREAKGRKPGKPFSVIAPSMDWVLKHTDITEANSKFISSLLPGPYTIVLKARPNVKRWLVSEEGGLGVRIPKHRIMDMLSAAGVPFVTTSVNLQDEKPVKSVKQVPEPITRLVDYAIDDGRLDGHPSRVFDLTGKEVKILRY